MNDSREIAIDCRLRRSTGIGRYIREVVPRVIAAMPQKRFLLLGPDASDAWGSQVLSERVRVRQSDAAVFGPAEQRLYRTVGSGVLWCPHVNVPWVRIPSTRLVVTIHDLILVHHGAGWRGRVRKLAARWFLNCARRNACRVLTDSGVVADELVGKSRFPRDRVAVVPLGVAMEWFSSPPRAAPVATLVAGPYLVYLGNLAPHKNVGSLFRAFAEVAPVCAHRLVVIGEERGFTGQPDLSALMSSLGDRIVITRRLDDRELRALVAGASLLVQPSFEEGFGLPPLEAMAAGCPVLTSDCPALLETAAHGAHRFQLNVPGDFAVQLERLLTDDVLRRSRITQGREWARQFTWDRTAEQTAAVLREVLES